MNTIAAVNRNLPVRMIDIARARGLAAKWTYVQWLPVTPAEFSSQGQTIFISPKPYVARLFANLLPRLNTEEDVRLVYRAFSYAWECHAGRMRDDGVNPYFEHVLSVAELVAKWGCGAEEIAAALCHDLIEDTDTSQEDLAQMLSPRVGRLVQGVSNIQQMAFSDLEEIADMKKIIQYSAGDLGVIIIKIADRLHNMRTLKVKSEASARRKAEQTLHVYAPFAEALGMWSVHRELQDLAFYYISEEDKKRFRRIKGKRHLVARDTKEQAIALCRRIKEQIIEKNNLPGVKVYLELRHVYELKERMEKRNIALENLSATDVWRICVVVPQGADCYSVQGTIRSLYPSIPLSAKDYICRPHANGHRFLMDYVEVPGFGNGEALLQIRDEQMWRSYRVGVVANAASDAQWQVKGFEFIKVVLHYLDQRKEDFDKVDFYQAVRASVHPIVVFTPIGEMLEMPFGSSVLDFAYRTCREKFLYAEKAEIVRGGVKVKADLFEELQQGDKVAVIINPEVEPDAEWFSHITSQDAIEALGQYLEAKGKTVLYKAGMAELDRESRKFHLNGADLIRSTLFSRFAEKYLTRMGSSGKGLTWNALTLLPAIARGKVRISWVIHCMRKIYRQELRLAREKGWPRSPFYIRVKLDAAAALDERGKLIPVYDLYGRLIDMGYTAPHTLKQTVDGKIIVVFAVDVYNDDLVGQIQRLQIKTIAEEIGETTLLDKKTIEAYEHYLGIVPRIGILKRIWLFLKRDRARALLQGD